MACIIPGVQITVVKEVAPPQLAPSGVLGLVGLTDKEIKQVERAASWSRFIQLCGAGSAYSLSQARQALANGVFELVVAPVISSVASKSSLSLPAAPAFKLESLGASPPTATIAARDGKFDLTLKPKTGQSESYADLEPGKAADKLKDSKLVKISNETSFPPKDGEYPLDKDKGSDIPAIPQLLLEARAPGVWANGFRLKLSYRGDKFDLEIRRPTGDEPVEIHRNLQSGSIADLLERNSAVLRVSPAVKPTGNPPAGDYVLYGGVDAAATEYESALKLLEDEADVDLVLADAQDFSDAAKITMIYSAVISHCERLSADSKGRLGFGQTPPASAMPARDIEAYKTMASTLLSDRFVLLAPHGVVGAVAGRVGSLDYFQSPTFKTLSSLPILSRALPLEEQSSLLQGHVVPVVNQRGRGVIVLRGLTTDGDQISVRRVADRAVRGVKLIGDLFIGRLNNEDGRGALKQKLSEFLVQMEREGALTPSTDGKDPSFKVDVYSTQDDFAKGIVRVDIAVRPVRAIDFIYATILVQV
jgi:hypothetical protein